MSHALGWGRFVVQAFGLLPWVDDGSSKNQIESCWSVGVETKITSLGFWNLEVLGKPIVGVLGL